MRAARAHPKTAHLDFEVVWAPFQLDETLPEAGEGKLARYSARFGAQRMAGMIDMMKKTGLGLSPPVAFSYGGLVSNTIASHVVLEAALVEGGPALQDRVVERFFSHCALRRRDVWRARARPRDHRLRVCAARGGEAAACALRRTFPLRCLPARPPARPPTRPPAPADFEKEGNIGDRGALLAMAVDAGMKEATAKALLEGAEAPIARQLVLKKERAREWPDLSQP